MQGNMAHTADQGGRGRRGNGGDGNTVRVSTQTIVQSLAKKLCTECVFGCGDTDFKCVTGDSGSTVYWLYWSNVLFVIISKNSTK